MESKKESQSEQIIRAAQQVRDLIEDLQDLVRQLEDDHISKNGAYEALWTARRATRRKFGAIIGKLNYTMDERRSHYERKSTKSHNHH